VHRFNHGAFFPRRHFARFDHFHHFRHRHHFPIFATAVGVSSCWRWVPTRWGWHRVWVCGV
jgi:hypothetical protein